MTSKNRKNFHLCWLPCPDPSTLKKPKQKKLNRKVLSTSLILSEESGPSEEVITASFILSLKDILRCFNIKIDFDESIIQNKFVEIIESYDDYDQPYTDVVFAEYEYVDDPNYNTNIAFYNAEYERCSNLIKEWEEWKKEIEEKSFERQLKNAEELLKKHGKL